MTSSDRRWRSTVRKAVRARTSRPGDVWVPIDELVSPLRYDILVRVEFFTAMRDQGLLYSDDPEPLTQLARDLPYHTWFTEVALPRCRPGVAASAAATEDAFRERVRTARKLFRSVVDQGFDRSQPILLRRVPAGSRSETGKLVRDGYQAGDGCHRVALLQLMGYDSIPPEMYRVLHRPLLGGPSTVVVDNTARLAGRLGLTREEYVAFVSRGFSPEQFEDVDALRAWVADHRPDRLAELESVLAVDTRLLTAA